MKVVRKPGPNGGTRELIATMKALEGVVGKVGFFESAKYNDKKGTPVAYVAAIHEYGSAPQGIPARPFFRPTIAREGAAWGVAFGKGAKAIVKGNQTPFSVMDAVGQLAAGDVKRTIADLQSPPLDPDTIAARRRRYKDKKTTGNLTKPLVDTSIMVDSVTNETTQK